MTNTVSKVRLQSKSNALNAKGIGTYLKGDVVKALYFFELSLALNKKQNLTKQ